MNKFIPGRVRSIAIISLLCSVLWADGLKINEFMASNGSTLLDEDSDASDWIEVYNDSASSVDLAGWTLTDDSSNLQKWTFPSVSLDAGDYLMVFASSKNRTNPAAELHTSFKLSSGGEYLALVEPGGTQVAFVYEPTYPEQRQDISYGLAAGGGIESVRFFPIPTPGSTNNLGYTEYITDPVVFSHASGMYAGSFALSLSSSNVAATIRYTTDGSDPLDSSPEYSAPISVTGSMQVKARLFESGKAPGSATFGSYLFLAPDVQSFSSTMPIMVIENFGAGTIPSKGYSDDGSGVVQVPRQEAMLFLCDKVSGGNALLSQPETISSMGIRGRGAYSTTFDQKPYSVELRDEDGNDKNRKLLGMPSESDWVLYWPDPDRDQTLLYNTFLYELSNQVGHYATRTRFVNAFINEDGGDLTMSDRVGMYILMEKVKRDKNRLDFDALSDDGTQGGWLLGINRMDAIPEGGVGTPQYFHTASANRVQDTPPNTPGLGDDEPRQSNAFLNFDEPNGYKINPTQRAAIEDWFVPFEEALWGEDFSDPVLGYERYLDSDDFIDYFQVQNLAKNGDALVISLWPYKESADGKLKMGPVWDFDFDCFLNSGSAHSFLRHGDERLWYSRLFQDIDFEQRYIDRWQAHRLNVYSDTNMVAIIDTQAAEITESIATFHGVNNWTALLTQWKYWISQRCAAIDSQYLAMPTFSQPGTFITPGLSLSLTSPGGGSIYYTLDGSDPRGEGGVIAPAALVYSGSIVLNTTTLVRARAKGGSNWSGIPEALFVVGQPDLAITEVMYHARDPEGAETNLIYSSSDYDFIEIQNLDSVTVSLLGVAFDNGIAFDFSHSDITSLAPGGHAVVVSNPDAFTNRYPNAASLNIAGTYEGELDNNGESVSLSGPHGLSHAKLTYSASRGWPLSADGAGHALVPLSFAEQATGTLDYGGNWRAGTYRDGSPGESDPAAFSTVVMNEFAAHTDNTNQSFPHDSDDWVELFNTAASTQNLTDWYLSDSVGDLRKWVVPGGTTVASGGWISFSETDGFNNPQGSGFGLNKAGEQILLSYLPGTDQDRVADAIRFKGQENGDTLGRYADGGVNWRTTVSTRDASNILPAQNVVISEVMYHPEPSLLNPADNTADEYIVLHNPTASPINLFNASGSWRLDGDADITLAGNTSLSADEYVLLVPFNPTNTTLLAAFQSVYGLSNGDVAIQGPFSGKLSNRTGKISLERPQAPDIVGQEISWVIMDELIYADAAPWPSGPDGRGLSLHRPDPALPGNAPGSWLQGAPSPASGLIGQPPNIANTGGADSITVTEASLHGELLSEGSDPATATLYWGSSDGDRDTAQWDYFVSFGTPGPSALVANLSELAGNTMYYYRYAASNSFGRSWADTSTSFTTLNPFPIITTDSSTNVTETSVDIRGTLVAEGCSMPDVFLYWGTSDGGMTAGAWDHAVSMGQTSAGPITEPLADLIGGARYYARLFANNTCGGTWSPASTSFTTVVPSTDFRRLPFRMKIDFPDYTSGTNLTDFPALVVLNESLPNFFYADFASATAGDLRFSDRTASSELSYEVEVWNTNGTSYVWVQIPLLENDTFIYAYWGNEIVNVAPEYTADGSTWSDDYAAVWHLNNNAGGTLPDSTANALSGANFGANNTSGVIGGGQDFEPYDFVHLGGSDITGPSTTEAWIYRESDQSDPALMEGGDYSLLVDQWGTPGYIGFTHLGSFDADFGVGVDTGSWHHVVWVFDNGSSLYIDGEFAGGKPQSIPSVLGTIGSPSRPLDARVDELRVSSVARGAEYMDATFKTTAQNSTFTGYYSVEDLSTTVDSDADGIIDQWELDHSGSRTGLDANAQTGDNDGLTYLEEFILDFNPAISDAPFRIQGIRLNPLVEVEFGATSTQRFYTVEYSTNLIEGVGWQILQSEVPGASGSTTVTDPGTNAARYYRLRVEQP